MIKVHLHWEDWDAEAEYPEAPRVGQHLSHCDTTAPAHIADRIEQEAPVTHVAWRSSNLEPTVLNVYIGPPDPA